MEGTLLNEAIRNATHDERDVRVIPIPVCVWRYKCERARTGVASVPATVERECISVGDNRKECEKDR